jgi:hypothetical protein
MRPEIDERPIALLRAALPEFEPRYLELVELYDEDLTAQVVFSELADFVTDQMRSGEPDELVERCCAMLERIALAPQLDAEEVVGWSFLDQLDPATLSEIDPYLGTATCELLARLDEPE